jgi:TRAP-type C4-dicarboxylate transport system substrate-binding protein
VHWITLRAAAKWGRASAAAGDASLLLIHVKGASIHAPIGSMPEPARPLRRAATLACPVALALQFAQTGRGNDRGPKKTEALGERNMTIVPVSRRAFIKSSTAIAAGLVSSPAIVGRAEAATMKLKCSSSLPNDPKFANGRVYYDNLVKNLKANGIGEQVEVAFFPDNQLGQEIDVINSVKLGVIDLMVSGSSISANLVPLVGTYDLGFLFSSFPQQTRAFEAGAAKPVEDALLKGANIRIIAWAYNFGSRSVFAKKPVKTPEDLAGLKIRTLPNPVITECLRLMGAAATPLAFGEIYTALQAGVLDGLEHDPPTILASKFFETAKFYALTQHNFSPLAIYFSDMTYSRMDPKLRDGFLDAANKAAVDTRAHGLAVEKEALQALTEKGVTVAECDREAFRKRVAPQTENFIKARPESKPIIDIVRATQA